MSRRRGPDCFPLARRYAPAEEAPANLLREPGARGRVFDYTERHLQAVWFDPRWRPATLTSSRGETIEVESPGNWNLEAGPDFIGAALRVGPEKRRITGDVEVHIFPAGWRQHGHRDDRRYRHVCLHLTYFEGHLPDEEFPAGALQAALRPVLKSDATFAFEHVDVTTYPYAGRADVPPCRTVLSRWPIEQRAQLLAAAGHERMRRKAERFAGAIAERGVDQVLYESLMTALGYQHNKEPFCRLASLLPVETLRSLSNGDATRAFALLAGVSGLLPQDLQPSWDDETRRYVRALWDVWWKERDRMAPPMARADWRLQGIRPLNHPLRRLAGAAHMFTGPRDGLRLMDGWCDQAPAQLTARMKQSFDLPRGTYWSFRASLGGKKSPKPVALLGDDRIDAMALNVVIPLAAACGHASSRVVALLDGLKPEGANQIIKQTAFYLFGPDHPAALFKNATRRQGLQQVFHDYCLGDRSRCAKCPFPGLLMDLQSK